MTWAEGGFIRHDGPLTVDVRWELSRSADQFDDAMVVNPNKTEHNPPS